MVAALASFLKTPGSLDSVFAVADSVKDGPLGEQALRTGPVIYRAGLLAVK